MYELVLGLLGALLGVGAFIFGYWFGYHRKPEETSVIEAAQDLTEEEKVQRAEMRQQLMEEQKAFSNLMSYNVNDAYGMNENPLERDKT